MAAQAGIEPATRMLIPTCRTAYTRDAVGELFTDLNPAERFIHCPLTSERILPLATGWAFLLFICSVYLLSKSH